MYIGGTLINSSQFKTVKYEKPWAGVTGTRTRERCLSVCFLPVVPQTPLAIVWNECSSDVCCTTRCLDRKAVRSFDSAWYKSTTGSTLFARSYCCDVLSLVRVSGGELLQSLELFANDEKHVARCLKIINNYFILNAVIAVFCIAYA